MEGIETSADVLQDLAGTIVYGAVLLPLMPWKDLYFATVISGSYEKVRMPMATKVQAILLITALGLFLHWMIES